MKFVSKLLSVESFMVDQLKVDRAAIRCNTDNTVHVVDRPGRHHNIIHRMARELNYPTPISEGNPDYTFGFVLSNGNFVDRKQAEVYARLSLQLTVPNIGGPMTSEDLW